MEVKESALSYNRKNWTIEEYLQMEGTSVEKHEYYQGEVFAMSGTKLPHVIICRNVFGRLIERLRGKSCHLMAAICVFISLPTPYLPILTFRFFAETWRH